MMTTKSTQTMRMSIAMSVQDIEMWSSGTDANADADLLGLLERFALDLRAGSLLESGRQPISWRRS